MGGKMGKTANTVLTIRSAGSALRNLNSDKEMPFSFMFLLYSKTQRDYNDRKYSVFLSVMLVPDYLVSLCCEELNTGSGLSTRKMFLFLAGQKHISIILW